MKKMRKERRLSPSMAVAMLALFVALAGSAYAAGRISGSSIKTNSLPGNRIKTNSITGKQINISTLGTVPNATHAATADNATKATTAATATNATNAATAANATMLNNLSSDQFLRSDTCQVGGIRGYGHFNFARMSTTALTANGTLGTLNCAGKAVLAEKLNPGRYTVKFDSYPGGYLICQVGPLGQSGGTTTAPPAICTVDEFAPGEWEIGTYNVAGTATDTEFTLLLY